MSDTPSGVEFLKHRYARAIQCGDARTATRLRAEIDRLINGQAADRERTRGDGCGAEVNWWQFADPEPVKPTLDYDDILGPNV